MKYFNPYKHYVGAFIPNWLMQRSEVSPGAKLCYARLCQFAGKDGKCYPSQETLAKELGVSTRQVQRYIQELQDEKLITTKRDTKSHSNTYYFLIHPWMKEGIKITSNGKEYTPMDDDTYHDKNVVYDTTNMSSKENHIKHINNSSTTDMTELEKVYRELVTKYSLEAPPTIESLWLGYRNWRGAYKDSSLSLVDYMKTRLENIALKEGRSREDES